MDITAYMTGKSKEAPHEELFWRTDRRIGQKSGVLRVGDFKLIVKGEKTELYNLKNDLSESTDLSKINPERVQEMLTRWQALDRDSQPPLWRPLAKGEGDKDEYQYKDYEWLKGSPHYRAKENQRTPPKK